MDTVVSCIGGKGGLLVLVENPACYFIIVQLKRITQQYVLSPVNMLRSGEVKCVKSTTAGNGVRNPLFTVISANCSQKHSSAELYCPHACAAWEKDSAENTSRMLQQFCPKGTAFDKFE